ncbi:imm11 family protein [Pseudomonas sp. CGJS7]|uniref:imm11 family protein n=1 Tax=Pseudomonas sp. CGJS7 TaxID=3109348 RepID=UPI003009B4BC
MTSVAAMHTNTQRVRKRGKPSNIDTDIRGEGPGHGVVIANEDRLLIPPRLIIRPESDGFPAMSEKPHLVYDLDARDMPRDIEASLSGYRLVSEPLKTCYTQLTHKALHSLQ